MYTRNEMKVFERRSSKLIPSPKCVVHTNRKFSAELIVAFPPPSSRKELSAVLLRSKYHNSKGVAVFKTFVYVD